MIKNISVVTRAFGYCPKCRANKEMEILEIEKCGVVARCTKCGTVYLMAIDIEQYFKNYRKKDQGGKDERKKENIKAME
ncbi:MAG: hypothetical protein GYA31_03045 [Parcubacteria group bacterium]|nr:hypothetical protein [Parcubacteria group bacterium]